VGDLFFGVTILLLTGSLWVLGAILHWYNIRRQEKLVARLTRLSARRRAVPAPEMGMPVRPEPVGDYLRPSKHWTIG
jgi:hypothetical protein